MAGFESTASILYFFDIEKFLVQAVKYFESGDAPEKFRRALTLPDPMMRMEYHIISKRRKHD